MDYRKHNIDLKTLIIWSYNDGKTRQWESGDDYYDEVIEPILRPIFKWDPIQHQPGDYICKISDFILLVEKHGDSNYEAKVCLFNSDGCIFIEEDITTIEEAKLVLEIAFLGYWDKWVNEILGGEYERKRIKSKVANS